MSAIGASNFKCNTCGIAFNEPEFQREHMKTEWHRYNLKRRVADLPPIPADIFAQKMHQVQKQETAAPVSRKQVTKKDLRRQEKEQRRQEQIRSGVANLNLDRSDSMSSVGFSAGEPSQNYVSSASEFSTDVSDTSDSEMDEQGSVRNLQMDDVDKLLKEKLKSYVQIPSNVSFMDGHKSENAFENVKYLEKKYGMVIPEEEHVSDWDGLVSYFNEKVGLGNCCLSCNYMGRSLAAVRAHMVSKQHCKVPWDTEEEQAEIIDFYDYSDSEGEGWEDVDGEGDEEDLGDDELESNGSVVEGHGDFRQPYISGYELVLPKSGRSAGHRSLNRYFKQRIMPAEEKPGRKAVRMIDYRSPGVTERAADKMVKNEWKEQKKAQQNFMKGRRMQNFQQHFRDPLLQ